MSIFVCQPDDRSWDAGRGGPHHQPQRPRPQPDVRIDYLCEQKDTKQVKRTSRCYGQKEWLRVCGKWFSIFPNAFVTSKKYISNKGKQEVCFRQTLNMAFPCNILKDDQISILTYIYLYINMLKTSLRSNAFSTSK